MLKPVTGCVVWSSPMLRLNVGGCLQTSRAFQGLNNQAYLANLGWTFQLPNCSVLVLWSFWSFLFVLHHVDQFCGFVWSFEGSVRRTFVVCADLPLFARSTTKPANFFWSLEHPGLLNTQLLHCKILLLLPSTNLGYGMFFHLCSAVDDQITTSHQRVWLQHLHFSSR